MASKEPPPHCPGRLSQTVADQIERLRRLEDTPERRSETRRLEAIAIRARELESLGERILSVVVAGGATKTKDPLEIPDFLRRY